MGREDKDLQGEVFSKVADLPLPICQLLSEGDYKNLLEQVQVYQLLPTPVYAKLIFET